MKKETIKEEQVRRVLEDMKLQRISFCTKTSSTNKETNKKTTKMVDQFLSCGAAVVEVKNQGGMGEDKKSRKYLLLAVPFDETKNTIEITDKDETVIDGYYRVFNLSNDIDGKVTTHTSRQYSAQVVAQPEWRDIGNYHEFRVQAENLRLLAEIDEEDRRRREELAEKKRRLLAKTVLPGWTSQ